MRRFGQNFIVVIPLVFALAKAHAGVVISADRTQNMTCSGGVCAPTASHAVLNNGDLETLLASGNVTITTTGSGAQANSIRVKKPFNWSAPTTLALDSHDGMAIDGQIGIDGPGGLTLIVADGGKKGAVTFGAKGSVSFANLASQLSIAGTNYQLEGDIRTMANDIARKPSGAYALAADYDASSDGVYADAPIEAPFGGIFTALGNVITNLTIVDQGEANVGLFAEVKTHGILRNVRLAGIIVRSSALNSYVGAVAGYSSGTIEDARVSGEIRGVYSSGGAIAGENDGTITASRAAGSVRAGELSGGLVGENGYTGTITYSWSAADVSTQDPDAACGGLTGNLSEKGTITNSYATGIVSCRSQEVGGFIGEIDGGTISSSYSAGRVSGGKHAKGDVGGFVGNNGGDLMDCYWDTTTSGTDTGAGHGSGSGLTGLTTKKFQSGLPTGFDPKIWAENSEINDGLPYLIANPPPR